MIEPMIPDNIKSLMRSLLDAGHEAYIIGGAVRDIILHETPSDWDLFTNASGEEILAVFPHGKIIGNEERRSKILTVVVGGVEISQYRRNGERTETGVSLAKHLSTCDFTMNAMAMDIEGVISDPHHGRSSLMSNYIDCVGNPVDRLNEDKIRALRAIRFAVKYKMCIETRLRRAIAMLNFGGLSVDCVRKEILNIIRYENGMQMVRGLYYLKGDLVTALEATYYLDGGPHHNETVYEHLNMAQANACKLTDDKVLIFACAMHDIGKPESMGRDEDGRTTFYGHEKIGAKILKDIMERMRFSNVDIKYVTTLVAEHMYRILDGEKTNRSLVRHFKRLEDAGISIDDYMVLMYCDNQANTTNPRTKFVDFVRANPIHKKYYELKYSQVPFRINDLEISGHDVMDVGVQKGPQIGAMLHRIFELVLCGELKNERHVLMYYIKHPVRPKALMELDY